MPRELEKLQGWYASNCDGEWEHARGVEITTLDNPGWSLEIDLAGTPLESRRMEAVKIDNGPEDWIYCSVDDQVFRAATSPQNLTRAMGLFFAFAEQ